MPRRRSVFLLRRQRWAEFLAAFSMVEILQLWQTEHTFAARAAVSSLREQQREIAPFPGNKTGDNTHNEISAMRLHRRRHCRVSSLAARGPSNFSEPVRVPARADKSVRVDDAKASVTVLKAAPIHANSVMSFSSFALPLAFPKPMPSPHERKTAFAETSMATLRRPVLASAEALPEQFLEGARRSRSAVGPGPRCRPRSLTYASLPRRHAQSDSVHPASRSGAETPDYSLPRRLRLFGSSATRGNRLTRCCVRLRKFRKATPRRDEVRARGAGVRPRRHLHGSSRQDRIRLRSKTTHRVLYRPFTSLANTSSTAMVMGESPMGRDNAIAGGPTNSLLRRSCSSLQTHKKATLDGPLSDPSAGHTRRCRARRASRSHHAGNRCAPPTRAG